VLEVPGPERPGAAAVLLGLPCGVSAGLAGGEQADRVRAVGDPLAPGACAVSARAWFLAVQLPFLMLVAWVLLR